MSAPAAVPIRPAAPPPPSAPGRRISVLRSLGAHRWLAVLVFLAALGAGLPLSYWKGRPAYYTEAVVYISPTFLKNLQEDKEVQLQSGAQYREFVTQNARTMNRYDVVFDALQKLGTRRFIWQRPGESDRRAAERLQGALDVKPVPDTYQVTIGLEGAKPDGLSDLVNTVADTYIKKERGEDFYASDRRVASLQQERARAEAEMAEKQAERARISQALAVSSFTESFQNPYDRLIQSSREALAAARQKRYQAESQLTAIDPSRGQESQAALNALAKDLTVHDSALTSLYSNLNARRSMLLAQISGLAPAHPGRKSIEREIAEIDKQLNEKQSELASSYGKDMLDQRRADVFQTRQVENALSRDVDQLSARASEFSTQYQRGLALGNDIEAVHKRLEAIDERVRFLTLESDAPGFARIFSYARPAETPIRSSRRKYFLLFGLGAMLLAIAVAVGVDSLDPRVYSANEAERILGFPPGGWAPERSETGEAFYRDQILRIAFAVERNASAMGAKIIVLTGVKPGAGTTTLCLGIAQELRNAGARAVVVEANAFKPDARYKGGPTLTGLLLAETSAGPSGSAMLPVGDAAADRRLPNLTRLREVLDAVARDADIVVVDAPPLLSSADSEFLARMADVAVLVVEAGAITRGELGRAARSLLRIRPAAVGAIVNRVPIYAAGGYYRELVSEFQSATRWKPSRLFSPWDWK